MSLGKLRTTELDLPAAIHPLPWQQNWSLLQPTASSPKHTSPREQLGLPSISGVPGFSKCGMAEMVLGASHSSVPPAQGTSWSMMHLLTHILELRSTPWILSCHADKTGQAVDEPPRASETQAPCTQFCSCCGPQPALPQRGLQNEALGPSRLLRRQAGDPQGSLSAYTLCAAMAGPSAGNRSASPPSLLLLLGHLACLGLCTLGWQLGDIHQQTWPLALFAVTRVTSCPLLNQSPKLGFLLARWLRAERMSCVSASPTHALIIHALHRFLGWKDLEQNTFFSCQKNNGCGN